MLRRFWLGAAPLSVLGLLCACSDANTLSAPPPDGGQGSDASAHDLSDVTLPPGYFASGGPGMLAYNASTGLAYVAYTQAAPDSGASGGDVLVIDVAAGLVTATIAVPNGNLFAMAVDASTNTLYAAGVESITVIDGGTNAITGTIPTPNTYAYYLAVDPSTHRVYAYGVDSALMVIDGITQSVVTSLPLTAYEAPPQVAVPPSANRGLAGLAVDPQTHTVWVAGVPQGNLALGTVLTTIDGAAITVTGQTSYEGTPRYLAASDSAPGKFYLVTTNPQTIVSPLASLTQATGETVQIVGETACGVTAYQSDVAGNVTVQAFGAGGEPVGAPISTGIQPPDEAVARVSLGGMDLVLQADPSGTTIDSLERIQICP
jgi:hypothetical protein